MTQNSIHTPNTETPTHALWRTLYEGLPLRVHPCAAPFVLGNLALWGVLFGLCLAFAPVLSSGVLVFGLMVSLWIILFFRHPERVIPEQTGIIVAPADGRITSITQTTWPEESGMADQKAWRISIFLNLWNVHIQRVALSGTVQNVIRVHGGYANAGCEASAHKNTHCITHILHESPVLDEKSETTPYSPVPYLIIQRAGFAARRIVQNLPKGTHTKTGDILGLIKFGSRVDLYFPAHITPLVRIGQTMIGGESIIANCTRISCQPPSPPPSTPTPRPSPETGEIP